MRIGLRDLLSILIESSLHSQSKTNIKRRPMLKPNKRNLKRINKSTSYQILWKSSSLSRSNLKNSWSKSHQRLSLFSPTKHLVWIRRLLKECQEVVAMVAVSLFYPGLLMKIRKISIQELILIFLSPINQMTETRKIISKRLNKRTKC